MNRATSGFAPQLGLFVVGLIIGSLAMYLAVWLPMLLGLLAASWMRGNVDAMAFGLLIGAAFGAVLCGLIGTGVGRYWPYPGRRRAFVAGALVTFLATAASLLFRASAPPAYGPALGYLVGGVALAFCFARAQSLAHAACEPKHAP